MSQGLCDAWGPRLQVAGAAHEPRCQRIERHPGLHAWTIAVDDGVLTVRWARDMAQAPLPLAPAPAPPVSVQPW